MGQTYADRLIAEMAPKEDVFEVHIVEKNGNVIDFPPLHFRVVRDYEHWQREAKAAAKFAENFEKKALPPGAMKDITDIASSFEPETLGSAYLLASFIVESDEWNVIEFLKISKRLGWVFLYLDQAFRARQMQTIPAKEVERQEELKKDS